MNITTAHITLMQRSGIDTGLVSRAITALEWPRSEWTCLDEAAVDYYHAVRQDIEDIIRPAPKQNGHAQKDQLLTEALEVIGQMGEVIQQGGFDSRASATIGAVKARAVKLAGNIAMELGHDIDETG